MAAPVVITYLAMEARPSYDRPSAPSGPPTALIRAEDPPPGYFLYLYDTVGRDYHWADRHNDSHETLSAFLHDPAVTLYTLLRSGWPHGFFMLDARQGDVVDLAYFGLVPQAIGLGLGTYLLRTAVHMAWDLEATQVTVNTCTLDHPRALGLYQKTGFVPVRRETHPGEG